MDGDIPVADPEIDPPVRIDITAALTRRTDKVIRTKRQTDKVNKLTSPKKRLRKCLDAVNTATADDDTDNMDQEESSSTDDGSNTAVQKSKTLTLFNPLQAVKKNGKVFSQVLKLLKLLYQQSFA